MWQYPRSVTLRSTRILMNCIMHFPFANIGKRSVYSPPPPKKKTNKQTNKKQKKLHSLTSLGSSWMHVAPIWY